jgi:prophage maintenance system killer protein
MGAVCYLSVQDILWINLQITKQVNRFHYATLEEGTFLQYGYGSSQNVLAQAAKFVAGFARLNPIADGNEATAFVACIAFLRLNDYEVRLKDSDALSWYHEATQSSDSMLHIERIAHPADQDHHELQPDVRAGIQSVLNDFPNTIRALASVTASA